MSQDSVYYRNPFILRAVGIGRTYFTKTPGWLKKLYPKRVWNKERAGKNIYLSFDDGPDPKITPFVLDELKKYKAHATFFCIGKNVMQYPEIFQRILDEGHCTGNHTHRHLNGWKTRDEDYLADIAEATKYIRSSYFRPPYGRLRSSQAKKIIKVLGPGARVVMWDVLSGDFDEQCGVEQCIRNVQMNSMPGSIVVFHDSQKAAEKLKVVLPEVLKFFSEKGYNFLTL